MTITKITEGNTLTVMLEGRLDTVTTPELEKELMGALDDIQELTFDFEKLSYISSAGLRVLLSSQKIMNTKGIMKVVHVNENIAAPDHVLLRLRGQDAGDAQRAEQGRRQQPDKQFFHVITSLGFRGSGDPDSL